MSFVHSTQRPPGPQNGVGFEHWPLLLHIDEHVCEPPSQNGLPGIVHWAPVLQSTHVVPPVMQTCVPPPLTSGCVAQKALSVALHGTHCPATQAGLVESEHANIAPEPRSPLHAWQKSSAPQTGVAGNCVVHVALVRHCTHVFVAPLQIGVAPVHRAWWGIVSVLHCTHAPAFGPDLRHTGVVGVAHA
jgi:hypothetical protein